MGWYNGRKCLLLGDPSPSALLSCFKYCYFLSVRGLALSNFPSVTGQQRVRPSPLHQVMRNKITSAVLLKECRYWRLFSNLVLDIWSSIFTFVHYITNLADSYLSSHAFTVFWYLRSHVMCACLFLLFVPQTSGPPGPTFAVPSVTAPGWNSKFRCPRLSLTPIDESPLLSRADNLSPFSVRAGLLFCYFQLRSIAPTLSKNASPPITWVAKIRKTKWSW
jgi:hypothetical protein